MRILTSTAVTMQPTVDRGGLQKPPSGPTPQKPAPAPRELLGTVLGDARRAAVLALVATTTTDRTDPTLPRSTQQAQAAIGRAIGLLDAAEGVQLLVPEVLYNPFVLRDPLTEAAMLIADAVNASPAAADPAAIAQARGRIASALRQFDYVMNKFWPGA